MNGDMLFALCISNQILLKMKKNFATEYTEDTEKSLKVVKKSTLVFVSLCVLCDLCREITFRACPC